MGHGEDYFALREYTINKLAMIAAGRRYVDDDSSTPGKHLEAAERVVHALHSAVHGGQAQSIAQIMLNDKAYNPVVLWKCLEAYYKQH